MNTRQQRNVSAGIAIAFFGALIAWVASNVQVAAPGDEFRCGGGICWDLFVNMPPEIIACMVLVGAGTFFALYAHRSQGYLRSYRLVQQYLEKKRVL